MKKSCIISALAISLIAIAGCGGILVRTVTATDPETAVKPVKVLYEEMLPHEFVERVNACPIAYLPLGTLEWHSYHLPYGTDMLMPLESFKMIAAEAGGVVLPPLFFGVDGGMEQDGKMYYGMEIKSFEDGHPQHLVGSAYHVPDDFFIQILEHTLANLKRNGFAALVAVGHGPSTIKLLENRELLEAKYDMRIFALIEFIGETPEAMDMAMDHAAFYETVMTLATRPDLVDLPQLLTDEIPVASWGRDPREATIAEGERLIQLYREFGIPRLLELNETLPKPNLKLEFHNVVDLTKEEHRAFGSINPE